MNYASFVEGKRRGINGEDTTMLCSPLFASRVPQVLRGDMVAGSNSSSHISRLVSYKNAASNFYSYEVLS